MLCPTSRGSFDSPGGAGGWPSYVTATAPSLWISSSQRVEEAKNAISLVLTVWFVNDMFRPVPGWACHWVCVLHLQYSTPPAQCPWQRTQSQAQWRPTWQWHQTKQRKTVSACVRRCSDKGRRLLSSNSFPTVRRRIFRCLFLRRGPLHPETWPFRPPPSASVRVSELVCPRLCRKVRRHDAKAKLNVARHRIGGRLSGILGEATFSSGCKNKDTSPWGLT